MLLVGWERRNEGGAILVCVVVILIEERSFGMRSLRPLRLTPARQWKDVTSLYITYIVCSGVVHNIWREVVWCDVDIMVKIT